MPNITKLKRGSLDGLRKQTNECLDNAYNKGYEDGAKNQDEVQYKNGYDKALEDVSNLIAFYDFHFMKEYYPEELGKGYTLCNLNDKYGLAEVLKNWKTYTKQKQVEEESIKVGDELISNMENKAIVIRVDAWKIFDCIDQNNAPFKIDKGNLEYWHKTGRNVADKLQELFSEVEE